MKDRGDTFLQKLTSLNVNYFINCPGVDNIISLTLPKCESEAMLLLLNEQASGLRAVERYPFAMVGKSDNSPLFGFFAASLRDRPPA